MDTEIIEQEAIQELWCGRDWIIADRNLSIEIGLMNNLSILSLVGMAAVVHIQIWVIFFCFP